MNYRKQFGQHFLVSKQTAKKIVDAAQISLTDTVLEIGTGNGILTPYLCKQAKNVISVEIDKNLYQNIIELKKKHQNLKLIHGNAFKQDVSFSVLVSSLPYSHSRITIEWLMIKKFQRCVLVVQKEFAEKLMSIDKKTAISVLGQYALDIKKISILSPKQFSPRPKVDSCIILIKQRQVLTKDMIKTVNKMFSQRRKTIQNIMNMFSIKKESQKRLDDLDGDEIITIAKQVI